MKDRDLSDIAINVALAMASAMLVMAVIGFEIVLFASIISFVI